MSGKNKAENWSVDDYIVAQDDTGISIEKLATLHTSTQNSYLVVSRNDDKVFALPLVNTVSTHANEAALGMLADVGDTSAPARNGSTAELYDASTPAAIVGAGDAPAPIEQIYVKGDAVFVSCAGETTASMGVFSSTPLFGTDGTIFALVTVEKSGGLST